jgi:hypothetical protein
MDVVYRTPATLVDQPEQDGLSNLHIRAPEPFFVSTRLGGSAIGVEEKIDQALHWCGGMEVWIPRLWPWVIEF